MRPPLWCGLWQILAEIESGEIVLISGEDIQFFVESRLRDSGRRCRQGT